MYDLAYKVTEALTESLDLPDSVIAKVFELMNREVAENCPALNRGTAPVKDLEPFLVNYGYALHRVLRTLPKVHDRGKATFTTRIRHLVSLSKAELYMFGKMSPKGFPRIDSESELPPEVRNFDGDFIRKYMGKLWQDLLNFPVSFDVPPENRFTHTYACAKTGTGKTELLAYLIAKDIQQDACVIVMAPKGGLIPNLSKLKTIDPERLILVRPEDDPPISLNLFNLGGSITQSVTLIHYVFSSILKEPPSPKQTLVLNHCVRLCLHHKNATLLTLKRVLEMETLDESFGPALKQLPDLDQEFFQKQFPNKKVFGDTKTEHLAWRIDALLENPLAQKLFTRPHTSFNLFDAMNEGKVLLIDTSRQHLSPLGSAFLGRIFIAMANLASQKRDPSKKLKPVYFYIDECADYLDAQVEDLLEKARESKIALTLANQQLQQLRNVSASLEASVLTNTTTKFFGPNAEDAATFARNINSDASFITNLPKHHFAFHSSGFLRTPLAVKAPFPYLETLPNRDAVEMRHLIEQNRAKYSATVPENISAPTPDTAESAAPEVDELASLNKYKIT